MSDIRAIVRNITLELSPQFEARLREQLDAECAKHRIRVHYPELALCTDNGAMIALAAAMRLQRGSATPSADYAFDVLPRWPLASVPSALS
mgnify:CR=1 FL=1